MERLLFQKTIDLNHQLHELVSLSVKDHLNYTVSKEGKRAQGTLEVEGEYYCHKEKMKFEDCIEIDILAPFNRLDEKEEFNVEIEDYDYHISSGNISLDIHVNAYGVHKKEDRHIFVDEDLELYEHIKQLTRKEELVDVIENTIEEVKKENVFESEGGIEDIHVGAMESNEDLFEEVKYVNYPYYIVKENDTYQSIAQHYQLDETNLRNVNQHKELMESTVVFLCKSF